MRAGNDRPYTLSPNPIATVNMVPVKNTIAQMGLLEWVMLLASHIAGMILITIGMAIIDGRTLLILGAL